MWRTRCADEGSIPKSTARNTKLQPIADRESENGNRVDGIEAEVEVWWSGWCEGGFVWVDELFPSSKSGERRDTTTSKFPALGFGHGWKVPWGWTQVVLHHGWLAVFEEHGPSPFSLETPIAVRCPDPLSDRCRLSVGKLEQLSAAPLLLSI